MIKKEKNILLTLLTVLFCNFLFAQVGEKLDKEKLTLLSIKQSAISPSSFQKAHLHFFEAQKAIERNDWTSAKSHLDSSIYHNPNFSKAYSNRGFIFFRLKEYPLAISDFNKALSLNDKLDLSLYGLGITSIETNQYQKAMDNFNQVDPSHSLYGKAILGIAESYYLLDKYQNALNTLDTIYFESNILKSEAFFWKSVSYFKINNKELAYQNIESAIQNDSLNPTYHFAKAEFLLEDEKYSEAIDSYNTAIELKENYQPALLNRSFAKMKVFEFSSAIKDLDKLVALQESDVFLSNRSVLLSKANRYSEAIQDGKKATELNPDNGKAFLNLGNAYFLNKEKDKACSSWERSAKKGIELAKMHIEQECKK